MVMGMRPFGTTAGSSTAARNPSRSPFLKASSMRRNFSASATTAKVSGIRCQAWSRYKADTWTTPETRYLIPVSSTYRRLHSEDNARDACVTSGGTPRRRTLCRSAVRLQRLLRHVLFTKLSERRLHRAQRFARLRCRRLSRVAGVLDQWHVFRLSDCRRSAVADLVPGAAAVSRDRRRLERVPHCGLRHCERHLISARAAVDELQS